MSRKAKILRKTKETNIAVEVNLDGNGKYQIKTKIGFFFTNTNSFNASSNPVIFLMPR